VLAPAYNPNVLARAASLASDISFLLQVPESAWEEHPMHTALLSPVPQALADYVGHVQRLADAADPSPLLAHAYVRYLGDLSGGQVIRRRISKAYGLEAEEGSGVRFYEFNELGGSKPANGDQLKKIKDWFRAGMNAGTGDDKALKAAILEEAHLAFELTNGILDLLKPPTSARSDEELKKAQAQTLATTGSEVGLLNFAAVISVVAAFCLAHFIFALDPKRHVGVQALQQWISDFF